jgi:hypothetical protein
VIRRIIIEEDRDAGGVVVYAEQRHDVFGVWHEIFGSRSFCSSQQDLKAHLQYLQRRTSVGQRG